MAQKKVSASELAKAKEAMKKQKRISGSASGELQSPSSNMLRRNAGGITGAGARLVNKIYRNMGN